MFLAGFDLAITASERPQANALERMANGIGHVYVDWDSVAGWS